MLAWEVQSTNELLWTAILHVYATPGDLTMVITITGKTLIQLHTETHYQFSMQHCPASGITQHACKFLGGVYRADQKPGRLATWAEIVFRAGQHRPFDTPLKSLHRCLSSKPTQPHSLYCIMRIDRYIKGCHGKGIHAFLSMSLLQYREHKVHNVHYRQCAGDLPRTWAKYMLMGLISFAHARARTYMHITIIAWTSCKVSA